MAVLAGGSGGKCYGSGAVARASLGGGGDISGVDLGIRRVKVALRN